MVPAPTPAPVPAPASAPAPAGSAPGSRSDSDSRTGAGTGSRAGIGTGSGSVASGALFLSSAGDLARQMRRAGASVLHNIAEGGRRLGRDRRQHYVIAAGSAAELRAALDVSEAFGYLDSAAYQELDALLDRVCAMLYRLTH